MRAPNLAQPHPWESKTNMIGILPRVVVMSRRVPLNPGDVLALSSIVSFNTCILLAVAEMLPMVRPLAITSSAGKSC